MTANTSIHPESHNCESIYDCKVKEVGNVQQLEHAPDETGHGTTLLVVKKARIRDVQDSPLCFEFAVPLREDIAHPLGLGSVGERNNEFAATPEDEHRSTVVAMRFTASMQNHTHAGQAPR